MLIIYIFTKFIYSTKAKYIAVVLSLIFEFFESWKEFKYAHRLFYSFIASDGSEGTTADRVVSPRSIMVHHGYRSKEARRAIKNIDYAKQHLNPYCRLHGKLMYPANSTMLFSWLTRSTPIFIVEERSNIYIYIYIYMQSTKISQLSYILFKISNFDRKIK